MRCYRKARFDTDIALWHGKDGLLAEIEKRGMELDFLFRLQIMLGIIPPNDATPGDVALLYWAIRRAEAPQLAAALIEAIEGL